MTELKLTQESMLEQCAEECAELAQACLKYSRKLRGENPTPRSLGDIHADLVEEIADVYLLLDIVTQILDVDMSEVTKIIEYKLERWEKRLEENENGQEEIFYETEKLS